MKESADFSPRNILKQCLPVWTGVIVLIAIAGCSERLSPTPSRVDYSLCSLRQDEIFQWMPKAGGGLGDALAILEAKRQPYNLNVLYSDEFRFEEALARRGALSQVRNDEITAAMLVVTSEVTEPHPSSDTSYGSCSVVLDLNKGGVILDVRKENDPLLVAAESY